MRVAPHLCSARITFRKFLLEELKRKESIRAILPVQHGAVLDVIFDLAHEKQESNGWRISDVALLVNECLRAKGEPGRLSEKRIGNILTTFHLTNRTRSNVGYVLWMDKRTIAQIHDLVRNYRYSLDCKSFKDCKLCNTIGATPGSGPKFKSN